MKVITFGHKYELENFEDKSRPGQVIQFIEKEMVKCDDPNTSHKLQTINDGTTNEEVLRMLIDRCETMFRKIPSEETEVAIRHMKSALYAFQSRTYDRQVRRVEGTYQK